MKSYKIFLLIAIVCNLWACSSDDDTPGENEIEGELFTEGQIDVDVTMPNNPIFDLYQQVDPAAGNVEEQMETLMEDLTEAEKAAIMEFQEAFGESNPESIGYSFAMISHALYGKEIYVKNSVEATTKYNTQTYHGEIRYNTTEETGQMYIENRVSADKQLGLAYTENSAVDGLPQLHLDPDKFNIEHTGETAVVSGHLCTKHVYTLKTGSEINSYNYLKVEAWTSELMPRSVNYVLPYYLNEDNGIMKLVIYHTNNENYPVVYEFANLDLRQVTDAEISIQQGDPMYTLPQDEIDVAFAIFGVIFGADDTE